MKLTQTGKPPPLAVRRAARTAKTQTGPLQWHITDWPSIFTCTRRELADYLKTHQITHTRGAPYHPGV